MRRWIISLLVMISVLSVALWALTRFWGGVSGHGAFAFILGSALTLGLSSGLFFLTFYSARHGHDEAADPGDIKRPPEA